MNRRLFRVLALCWAVVCAALPGALSAGEGEAAGRAAVALAGVGHVEDETTPGCSPVHEAGCAVCTRLASGGDRPDGSADLRTPSRFHWRHGAHRDVARPTAGLTATAAPRAPPAA